MNTHGNLYRTSEAALDVKRYVFLLLDKFSMMSFSAAIEPLRLANLRIGQQIYDWKTVSEDGETVRASNGIKINVDGGLEDLGRNITIIVCGGVDIQETSTKPVLNWLRREARKGYEIGGICTAAYTLARAGLLDGKRATIHWENSDSFAEEFPDIDLTKSVFCVDGKRFTSSGGTSSLDMMLKVIATEQGQDAANWVADQAVYSAVRSERDEQRLSVPTRIGVRHPKLSAVIKMMEASIEEPVSPSILAEEVGMSTRQLERLFRKYLDRSPKRYYMELRLQKARNLLLQTDMSVINVALACGFYSPSHFSKCYRAQYEITPYRERGAQPTRKAEVISSQA
ncbi:MAG: GlxA family transcriptional regulator [Pseudomonadota bacterium]